MVETMDIFPFINDDTCVFSACADFDAQAIDSFLYGTLNGSSSLQMVKEEQCDNRVYQDISNNTGYSSGDIVNGFCFGSLDHQQIPCMFSNPDYFRGDGSGSESSPSPESTTSFDNVPFNKVSVMANHYTSYGPDHLDSDNESVTLSDGALKLVREHDSLPKPIYSFSESESVHHRMQTTLPHFDKVFCKRRQRVSKRGRPNTYPKCLDGSESDDPDDDYSILSVSPNGKNKRGAKNILLWKFLLEQLADKNATHVQWLDEKNGIFRFTDTAETSRLWGQLKKKTDMNFEKLSRGIRHYYKDGLMERMNGTRLVYKFNWSKVPRRYHRRPVNQPLTSDDFHCRGKG
ncbi:hypothetical protein CHS0354_010384 [Potamilus streckersoni]|uniref:ETS domain-containing protein n=1 Tax=Potamilus streckersoni TaxID=2493646 RepID=A0AAE0TDQ4_9BIVA|nr:hypothetical protein CHS0354_010384 [Potamilus streckersoni]